MNILEGVKTLWTNWFSSKVEPVMEAVEEVVEEVVVATRGRIYGNTPRRAPDIGRTSTKGDVEFSMKVTRAEEKE